MAFSESYHEARTRFCTLAANAEAQLLSYRQPDATGAEGEALSIDLALWGPSAAERAAIVFTGVHGAEGFCGSAVLQSWLSRGPLILPDGVRLVLVHAANPWAFSHMTRTTENNVDLNRNFLVDWTIKPNQSYRLLRDFLHQTGLDATANLEAYSAYREFLTSHGWEVETEMVRGQSEFPDGLYFTGFRAEWANLTLRQIMRDTLSGARQIGFLDIHTGLGQFGEILHLIFAPEGSEARDQAQSWWGRVPAPAAPFASGGLPAYEGLLCNALAQELPAARIVGAVMEFGVADAFGMFRSDRLDRWLRFEGKHDPDLAQLRREYRDSCAPRDVSWRRLVLRAGPEAIDRLLAGLAKWPS